MDNSTVILGIVLIFFGGLSTIPIGKLIFKKSLVFKVYAFAVVPLTICCMMAFIMGARGVIHIVWALPAALVFFVGAFYFVWKIISVPLKEMTSKVLSLSDGDANVSFNEKYLNGEDEIAHLMRMLLKLTNSQKNIASFAQQIGKGDFDAQYDLLSDHDALGKALLDMRQSLQIADDERKDNAEKEVIRNWASEGLTKFSEILRNQYKGMEELCHAVISNLVKYIDVNQGCMFILNDDDPQNPILEMASCYAYERSKYLHKTVVIGEGLIGTCFLEGKSIYITNIPAGYIRITSGLGDATPRSVFITPLKFNDKISGILEVASFNDFAPHVREFIEKLSESIASTIVSIKINANTDKLLEEARLQRQTLANQEEELRQNMEEMAATQEESNRRERELQETIEKMRKAQEIS